MAKADETTMFTIGYEGLDVDAFMSLLAHYGIETVVDVRQMPLSRKPGFSKKTLSSILNMSGREYVHMVDLGCPKPVRDRYRVDGDWKRYTEAFLIHLKAHVNAITELSELVTSSNCTLICYEADYNYCHRSMVANAVHDYCGVGVKHIKKGRINSAGIASLESFQLDFV
jgi:uncharacterized protein (DUF488 family)